MRRVHLSDLRTGAGQGLGALLALSLLTAVGCVESNGPPQPPGTAAPPSAANPQALVTQPPAAPITKAVTTPFQRRMEKRRLAALPPPPKPIPRPVGEPKNTDDMQKLSAAAAEGKAVDKPGAPPIERIDQFRVRIGRVLVDRQKRRLEVPSKLNMTEGILEYYAVASNGKLHESVLEVGAEPSHIHLGLILLGVAQIQYDYGDYSKPPVVVSPGGRLKLRLQFPHPKTRRPKIVPAESWLYNRGLKGPPRNLEWTFVGSTFWNNRYGADMDRSVIALIPDQGAVIGTTEDTGNPYQGDGLGFEVYTKVVPAKGTPVTLIIDVIGDGKSPAKD